MAGSQTMTSAVNTMDRNALWDSALDSETRGSLDAQTAAMLPDAQALN